MAKYPHFNLHRAQLDAEQDFQRLMQNRTPQQITALLSIMAATLLRSLRSPQSLQDIINLERAGSNPQIEGTLRQILSMDGINVEDDILYGEDVSADVRQRWQLMGIDPNSEGKVVEFLKKNNVIFLSKQGMSDFVKKMEDTRQNYAAPRESPTPPSTKLK